MRLSSSSITPWGGCGGLLRADHAGWLRKGGLWVLVVVIVIVIVIWRSSGVARAGAPAPGSEFCGVVATVELQAAVSCKLPGLPCGPVAAEQIGPAGAEAQEDLDGDGRPDVVLAGRRGGPRPVAYGVIYLARQGGFVLSDYHPVEADAEPTMATVVLPALAGPPLLRDGHDVPLADGNTLSVARLRRWDGAHFRTLLTFCAHRIATLPDGTLRDGQNRVEFVDVDRDGTKEVVLRGHLRPLVFRFSGDGLSLHEDPALTRRYRDESPEERKAKALREQAARLASQGEWRRAASALEQALSISPYNEAALLQLVPVLLRLDQSSRALLAVQRARMLEPERASTYCALAQVYRAANDDEEEPALRACLERSPTPALQKAAEDRLRAIKEEDEKERQRDKLPADKAPAPKAP